MKIKLVSKELGLQGYDVVEESVSRLGGQNLRLKNSNGTVVFLKVGQGAAAESLIREKRALEWLSSKQINVPKVLNYLNDKDSGVVYLSLSAVKGSESYKTENLGKDEILSIAASALKQLHTIGVDKNSNLWTLDDDLDHIRKCLRCGLVKREDFQKANGGKTADDVYAYLLKMKGKFANDVIVHGDYCLPNILISKKNYGLVDLGNCGPGDPYKDFSAMEVSITRNFGKEWIKTFYKHYGGIKEVDTFKIEYYQLIDQFCYHLDIDKYKVTKC
jgi:aminoglycoside phosphotransferase